MASQILYDPDDFENNNPFAEPEDYTPHLLASMTENDTTNNTRRMLNSGRFHEREIGSTEGLKSGDLNEQGRQSQDQSQDQNQNQKQGQLVREELMKLIPERFCGKYRMKLTLRAIEENRPENPILRFDAVVAGLLKYRQKEYTGIRRTFSEILKFNRYLVVSNLEVFVPVIPLAITSYPSGGEDERKQLMYVWQEWMDRITRNPILVRDEEFVYFLENDFGYSVINTHRKMAVASGFVRKTLKQLAVPYDPYEELAEFRPMVKSAYVAGQKLQRAIEKNQKNNKQLAVLVAELSLKLKGLAHFETVHPGMKNMWEKLSNIAHIQSELALLQLISDLGSLGDGMQALVDDLYEIKEALTNRHLIMRELMQAQSQTRSKHLSATKIKNRSSLDPIKVDEAMHSLENAVIAEESLNMQVKRILGEMMFERKEAVEFCEKKFQRMLKLFSLSRIDQHRKLLKHLDNIRLDVRIIDANGGLSRLNRDNLSQMKHNLHQSQAETGDAWTSRTFRSLASEQADRKVKLRARESDEDLDAKLAASLLGATTFAQ